MSGERIATMLSPLGRNVLTAVWLFKQAGKLRSRRNEDSMSNLSLESEIVESATGKSY